MNDYFEDYCSRDVTNLNLQIPCYIFDYLKGSHKSDQGLDNCKANITCISSELTPDKHEPNNQSNALRDFIADSKVFSLGYNLFDSKQAIANQLIHQMSSIGKDRDRARKENLYQIESDILKCHNQLLELGGFYLGQCKAADQKRLSIEQRLFDLYRERREQQASCWRDQLWLKRDLIAALKEYLDIQRRKNLFVLHTR